MTETAPSHPAPLSSALLLATTGGLLDAFVYIRHGHVFATAVTGNVVLLSVSLVGGNWRQAAHHLGPVLAFLVGVAASRLLRQRPRLHAALSVLVLEMVVLFLAGLLPAGFPELAFTALITFVSACQVSTFRQAGRLHYYSTFVTGNLRECTEGLANCFLGRDAEQRRQELSKARQLAGVCGCFLLGGVVGGWGGMHLDNRTLWLAEPLLLITAVRIYRTHTASEGS